MTEAFRAWVDRQVALGSRALEVAATAAVACAELMGLPTEGAPALMARVGRSGSPEAKALLGVGGPPRGLEDVVLGADDPARELAGLVGEAFERAHDPGSRHRRGVHYTPPVVADELARLAVHSAGQRPVCDPAVGAGAFLLAAGRALEEGGVERSVAVRDLLWGIDIDPEAVMVAEASLALWGSVGGEWVLPRSGHLVAADTLVVGIGAFDDPPEEGFGLVVGNPPFQGQLAFDTARSSEATAALRTRWATDAGPYADTAAFFLLAGEEMLAPGGAMVLIQPKSVLSSADTAPIRERLDTTLGLSGMWLSAGKVFGADVEVCAPVLGARDGREVVRRWLGPDVAELEPTGPHRSWSAIAAGMLGAPSVALSGPRLGDRCSATAGFRDQFYGLAEHTVEADAFDGPCAPLVTVGMIDPLRNRWGSGSFRFAGRSWAAPVVDLEGLRIADPALWAWVDQRLRPKVLVATQTRVLEVVADPEGRLVPSTPVVSVECEAADVWLVAAALSSPALTAEALARAAGASMSADTVKLSATQVLDLPAPTIQSAWEDAAVLAREASTAGDEASWQRGLRRLGLAASRAHGVPERELTDWWTKRLPRWR